jgi:hypothetical protein
LETPTEQPQQTTPAEKIVDENIKTAMNETAMKKTAIVSV